LKIDIAIPVYNEEETLETQVLKLDHYLMELEKGPDRFEIIIADNGSNDRTYEIAQVLANRIKRVRVVAVGEKGVGLALRRAWEKSEADIIGYMDLDLATDVSHIPEVLSSFTRYSCDVVNASRLLPESVVQNRSTLRNITSRGLNVLLRVVFRTNITDGMCGFKFVRRNHLDSAIKAGANSNGWFFATQLLLVSEANGLKIIELPVRWIDDGKSKVKVLRLSKQYLKEIYDLRKTLKKSNLKKYVRR
jgi:glycosyltransferase involved in cell wall biosynthesis